MRTILLIIFCLAVSGNSFAQLEDAGDGPSQGALPSGLVYEFDEGTVQIFDENKSLRWEILLQGTYGGTRGPSVAWGRRVPETVYFEKQVVRDNLELQIVSRRKVQREDVSRRFSEDGIVLYEFKHQRPLQHSGEITTYPGVENGTYREFHPDGSLAVHLLLQDGKAYGRGATYYPTGKKESEFQFQENEVEGAANLYYADGRLRLKGAFEEGSPEGLTQLYHENGKV